MGLPIHTLILSDTEMLGLNTVVPPLSGYQLADQKILEYYFCVKCAFHYCIELGSV